MNVKFALFAGLLLSMQAFALDNTANQTKPTNDVPTQADIQRLFDEEVKAINRNMIINNPIKTVAFVIKNKCHQFLS